MLDALDEFLSVAREADISASVYHLKASGTKNWPRLTDIINKIEAARAAGLDMTANMYTYTAGATGLDAAMPPWVQAGGDQAWVERLKQSDTRLQVRQEMKDPDANWDNLLIAAGADGTLFTGFRRPQMTRYMGKTLSEIAQEQKVSPEDAAINLVIADGSETEVIYFLMSEANVVRKIGLPWMAFGSDARALAVSEPFTARGTHPRAYGNVARLLGRYVREQAVISLSEAIRRLTQLPAKILKLRSRGNLAVGQFADVVVFNPDTVIDHATYVAPHQYATGVVHVFVNGIQTLQDGQPTQANPGRVVRGPGWRSHSTVSPGS